MQPTLVVSKFVFVFFAGIVEPPLVQYCSSKAPSQGTLYVYCVLLHLAYDAKLLQFITSYVIHLLLSHKFCLLVIPITLL